MGAHTRPRHGIDGISGRHRGQAAPLFDVDLGAAATRAGAVLATGAAAATVVVAGAGLASAAPARPAGTLGTPAQFAALRQCESSGNYAVNTGNGFYGAYQFDLPTWDSLGYTGLPSAATPAVQDQAARTLQAERGWEPWPACSASLGLDSGGGSVVGGTFDGGTIISVTTSPAVPVATAPTAPAAPAAPVPGVPAFDGPTFTTALEPVFRADVELWQQRMVARGWHLTVDGSFGPQSAHIAAQFVAEKGLSTRPGTVDAQAWKAAWTLPVTP